MTESKHNLELEEKIDLYLDGKLSAAEVDELWAELIQDEYYYDYLKTAASLKGLANENKAEKKDESHKTAKIFTLNPAGWMAAAAVLVIAIGLAVFNLQESTYFEVKPVSQIELDYYRSAEGTSDESVSSGVLIEAIRLANNGDVSGALTILELRAEETDEIYVRQELLVTAGSILYNTGQYREAAERFEKALDVDSGDPLLMERNYWYLGNTYFQLNKIVEAKEALERAHELNGAYSRVAKSYLKALSE